MDRHKWLDKFFKETDNNKLEDILFKFKIATGYSIERRGENTTVFSGNPDKIIDEFSKFVSRVPPF